MNALSSILLLLFEAYGNCGAMMPSFHGSYETPVPEELKQQVTSSEQFENTENN